MVFLILIQTIHQLLIDIHKRDIRLTEIQQLPDKSTGDFPRTKYNSLHLLSSSYNFLLSCIR